jgi:hypothetical protein
MSKRKNSVTFRHPLFTKDKQNSLDQIKRRTQNAKFNSSESQDYSTPEDSPQNNHQNIFSPEYQVRQALNDLKK